MQGKVRRIVTGHDEHGKAIIASDDFAPNIVAPESRPGYFLTQMWSTPMVPAVIGDDNDPSLGQLPLAPPENGTVFRIIDFPPESASVAGLDATGAQAAFASIGGKAHSTFQPGVRHPMMHRTESIDYGIILSGEITLILDDTETIVRAGDVVIQCGTNHAWANRSGAVCKVAFILIDGKFKPELARKFG